LHRGDRDAAAEVRDNHRAFSKRFAQLRGRALCARVNADGVPEAAAFDQRLIGIPRGTDY